MAPGRGPRGVPLPHSRSLGLRNSLRSDSPRPHIGFGTGAQPRPQAPGNGAMRHIPGFDPGWRGYEYLNEYNCLTVESGFWLNGVPGIERAGLCLRHQIHYLRG